MPDFTRLYRAAVEATSLQDLLDAAYALFPHPMVAADSIHNLLARSRDVADRFGPDADWQTLMQAGCLPPPPDSNAAAYGMPLPAQLENAQPIRISYRAMESGAGAMMCDLREQNHVFLKLAVMELHGESDAEAFARALAESCFLLYFRLLRAGVPVLPGQGRCLLRLIAGDTGQLEDSRQWLGIEPPCFLLVLPPHAGGVVALSFSQLMSELEQALGKHICAVTEQEQLVMLIHADGTSLEAASAADPILRRYHQPVGISEAFADLKDARAAFSQAEPAIRSAMLFQGFSRCARQEEFAVFELFETLLAQDADGAFFHPDAVRLARVDEKRSLSYLETVFCWLCYEKNAQAAAKHLFVHRNTLDNRMAKITSLIHADWDSGGYCVRMFYSAYALLKKRGALRDSFLHFAD